MLVAAGLVACGRGNDSRPRAERRAAPPSLPAPSAVAAPRAAPRSAGAPSAESSEPAAKIAHVTGAELLESVRAQGGVGTLVNVWATWCGPCRRELPMLRSLAANLSARGLSILLVSVDEPESEPNVIQTLEQEGFAPPFFVAKKPLGAFKRALHPTWPGMIPVTFLFDATGKRRYFWGGPVHEQELLPKVEGLLAGENIDGEARFELAPGRVSP